MQPTERPRNDNWNPADGEPPEPGLFSTRKRAIESTFALTVIALLIWFMLAVLDAAHWRTFGVLFGIGCLCIFAAAIWRRIIYGRA